LSRSIAYHETQLQNWKADPQNEYVPDKSLISSQIDISGHWAIQRGLDASELKIVPQGKDSFAVEFYTSGCLDRWLLHRTATFKNGLLELDRPVDPYGGKPYDKLYAIRLRGRDYLLPSTQRLWKIKPQDANFLGSLAVRGGFVDAFEREPATSRPNVSGR
jgi:hypothetical protein